MPLPPARETPVLIERGALSRVGDALISKWRRERVLLITDGGVLARAGMGFSYAIKAAGVTAEMLLMPMGQAARAPGQLTRALARMDALRMDASCGVLALGGSSVMSIARMASSIYLGGMPLALMPTTPTASLGSWLYPAPLRTKSGADGAMTEYAPDLVVIDPDMLSGLPKPPHTGGAGEALRLCAMLGEEPLSLLLSRPDDPPWEELINILLPGIRRLSESGFAPNLLGWPLDRALCEASRASLPRGASSALAAIMLTRLTQREGLTRAGTYERLVDAARRLGLPTEHHIHGLGQRLSRDPLGLKTGREAPYITEIGSVGTAMFTAEQLRGAAAWRG